MKQLTSLLWKEWREARLFLWLGLGMFIGLPCIMGIEGTFQFSHRFEFFASPAVIPFGGVFALFVAVGATCRDLSGHVEEFWRSRPVSVIRWFLVKYAVGLAVSLVVCLLPLLLERWLSSDISRIAEPATTLLSMPFLWAALYSVAFAAGCLVRRPAHAAMLALAGLLLIYFLPLVLPPLNGMNAITILDSNDRQGAPEIDRRLITFAVELTVVTSAMLALALAAVRFRWRIDAGRRLMYGAVSSALLIIFATAGYQLRTDLPILQEVNIPHDERVGMIHLDGDHGLVTTVRGADGVIAPNGYWINQIRPIVITSSGITVGEPTGSADRSYVGSDWISARRFTSPPGHPEIKYSITDAGNDTGDYQLAVHMIDPSKSPISSSTVKLWAEETSRSQWPQMESSGNRLYVIGAHLVVLDVTNPLTPRVLSNVPFSFRPVDRQGSTNFRLNLPDVPGLPKEQRLSAAVTTWGMWYFPADGILCETDPSDDTDPATDLIVWHLDKLTDDDATFKLIGDYKHTFLEDMFGASLRESVIVQRDGLLYVLYRVARYGSNHVAVFDLRSAHPLRPVGHFGAPDIWTICPLPDGRALIGGSKLWLVGPPLGRN